MNENYWTSLLIFLGRPDGVSDALAFPVHDHLVEQVDLELMVGRKYSQLTLCQVSPQKCPPC